jgi:hypothetical protein
VDNVLRLGKRGRSLIETTIKSYLEALVEKVRQPDPGRDIRLTRDYSAISRAAADRLMRGPAWAGGDFMGLGDICNTISLQNGTRYARCNHQTKGLREPFDASYKFC